MLNAFPYLLSFSSYSPLILRVVAGIYFLIFAYDNLEHKWPEKYNLFKEVSLRPEWLFAMILIAIELAGGILLISGACTQIVAMALAVLILVMTFIMISRPGMISRDLHFNILLLAILITLIFTGAGNLAADYPF